MKFALLLLSFITLSSHAAVITMKEAQNAILSKAAFLDKLELGMSADRSSWITLKPSNCKQEEKEVSTIISFENGAPVILKEYTLVDPCFNKSQSSKVVELGDFKFSHDLVQVLEKTQSDAEITLDGNLLSFYRLKNGESFRMQFQLNTILFYNWVHYHQSFKNEERHNIRNEIKKRTVSASEITGVAFCRIDGDLRRCEILSQAAAEKLLQ